METMIRNAAMWSLGACCLVMVLRGPLSGAETPDFNRPDFNREVRPILSAHCFKCHGPDDKRRKGDLRLDTKEGAFHAVDGRQAFVPGNLDRSEAWRRITTKDADDHMPPAKSGKQLTAKQIETYMKLRAEQKAKDGGKH